MSNTTFKELEAVVIKTISPEIRKHFEEIHNLYNAFSKKDYHPWLTNLREMMRMLDCDTKLPHYTDRDLYDHSIHGMPCNICSHAASLREAYQQEKSPYTPADLINEDVSFTPVHAQTYAFGKSFHEKEEKAELIDSFFIKSYLSDRVIELADTNKIISPEIRNDMPFLIMERFGDIKLVPKSQIAAYKRLGYENINNPEPTNVRNNINSYFIDEGVPEDKLYVIAKQQFSEGGNFPSPTEDIDFGSFVVTTPPAKASGFILTCGNSAITRKEIYEN